MSEEIRLFTFEQTYVDQLVFDHWKIAEDYIEGILSDEERDSSEVNLIVNPRRLYLAIESSYQDIERYKNFHQSDPGNEKLDCTKRCAFLLKWVPRFKPIQRLDEGVEFDDISKGEVDDLELLNESFALYLFEVHLSDEIEQDVALSEQKFRHFAYDLLYRNISKDGWISILQLIKECCMSDVVEGVSFVDKI